MKKIDAASFDYEDFMKQNEMISKMGSMRSMVKMMPGAPPCALPAILVLLARREHNACAAFASSAKGECRTWSKERLDVGGLPEDAWESPSGVACLCVSKPTRVGQQRRSLALNTTERPEDH